MTSPEETEELEPQELAQPEEGEEPESAEAPTQAEDEEEVEYDFQALLAERDDYMGRWQRAQADYQNLKRRSLADLESGIRREVQPLLENMLLVLDYLDMALQSPTESQDAQNLAMGVSMTRDQFVRALEDYEVRPIPTEVPFDPETHQAVARVEIGQPGAEEAAPGAIVETVRGGYTWRFGVLRHAQVRVAAEPAAQAEEEGGPIEQEGETADEAPAQE